MRWMIRLIGILGMISLLGGYIPTLLSAPTSQTALPIERIHLPHGFKMTLFATNISSARMMALGDNGTLFIGTRGNSVYAIPNATSITHAQQVLVIDSTLNAPGGVAFKDGALYVGTNGQIWRYDNIEANLTTPPVPVLINDTVPASHGMRTIRFGPNGKLYIKVGAPCNVCENTAPYASTIVRMNPNGTNIEVYASGIRNAVGYDWHPVTGELWFTNNGRDLMGDDLPPETLNHAPTMGLNFGFPYCHAGNIPDPEFGHLRSCNEFAPPAQLMPAHVAPLGMRFYVGDSFPPEYHHQIFIAEHGSWNRSSKIGYRISLVRLDENNVPLGYEIFADGWLGTDESVWGRPVDVQPMPDGALLISDDYAGAIYRVQYICSHTVSGGQAFTEQDFQHHLQTAIAHRPAGWQIQNVLIDLVNCGLVSIVSTTSGEIGMVKVSISDTTGLAQIAIDTITALDGVSPMSASYQMTMRTELIPLVMQGLQTMSSTYVGDNAIGQIAITNQNITLLAQP